MHLHSFTIIEEKVAPKCLCSKGIAHVLGSFRASVASAMTLCYSSCKFLPFMFNLSLSLISSHYIKYLSLISHLVMVHSILYLFLHAIEYMWHNQIHLLQQHCLIWCPMWSVPTSKLCVYHRIYVIALHKNCQPKALTSVGCFSHWHCNHSCKRFQSDLIASLVYLNETNRTQLLPPTPHLHLHLSLTLFLH